MEGQLFEETRLQKAFQYNCNSYAWFEILPKIRAYRSDRKLDVSEITFLHCKKIKCALHSKVCHLHTKWCQLAHFLRAMHILFLKCLLAKKQPVSHAK